MNKTLVMSVILATMLAACSSNKPKEVAKVEDKSMGTTTQTVAKTDDSASTKGMSEGDGLGVNPLKDPNNILSKRSVYFDYDKDEVKAEYRALVEAHAKYLLAHPDAKVMLQGNCDDRGSREYNLALGQKRSVAVKKVMNLLGVQDKQIETVSYGEEKAGGCKDEACYAQNRRADIAYEND